jgi:hypothetical protein
MWWSYKLLLPVMMLYGLCLLMTGCASTNSMIPTTATAPPSSACAVWPTISYSGKNDTPETVRQIISSNAARKAVCG